MIAKNRVCLRPPREIGTDGDLKYGNVSVTIVALTILEFLERDGSSPLAKWFAGPDAAAAAKVTTAVRRLELGNFSNVKGVGAGGNTLVILLGGGTKKMQDRDIGTAHVRWQDYKKRKAEER